MLLTLCDYVYSTYASVHSLPHTLYLKYYTNIINSLTRRKVMFMMKMSVYVCVITI